jgi:hypothetical protein
MKNQFYQLVNHSHNFCGEKDDFNEKYSLTIKK